MATTTNLNSPETYIEDIPLNLTDIVVTNANSSNITVTLLMSNIAAGRLSTATSGTVTSSYNNITGEWRASGSVADVNVLLADVTFVPTLNFNGNFTLATSVVDGISTLTGSKIFTGIAIDDAPVATNLSTPETYIEDTPLNLTDIVVTDVDSPNVTVTLTLLNTAAGSLNTATSGSVTSTYNPVTGLWSASGAIANVNALLAGVTFTPVLNFNGNFTINTSVSDGNTTTTSSKFFLGTAVDDAPIVSNLSVPESYTEDTPVNLTDIVIADVDSANVTAILTLSNKAAGSLSIGTSGTVTSTYSADTGIWFATGAIADVNALLADVTFTPTLNFNANFTVATSVSDGHTTLTGIKNFTGIPVNDAPIATNLSAPESYTEDTPVNLTDIVVTDVDNANVGVTLTLSNTAAGSLSTATSGAVTSNYNTSTGVWSATGAIANVNALLAGVIFTPTLNFNGNFNIATSVSDGVAPAITGSKAFTGTAVNDAPTATNFNAPQSYTEDTPVNLTGIVVTDVDSANVGVTLTLSDTAAGSLSTATSGFFTSTYDPNTGIWSAIGTIADVNALLASVVFTPALNFNSNFTIATSVSDGVAPTITGSKSFTGIAVNDAPIATNLSAPETYTEDTTTALTDIVVTDVDNTNVTAILTLSNITAGSLSTATSGAVTSSYNTITGVWTASGAVADVNTLLAGVSFTPALNFNGNFTIATSVSDGTTTITGSKSFTGIAVNDAPTATNLNAPETYTEDTPTVLTDIVVTDVDSANIGVILKLSNTAAGSLSTATSGLVTSNYDINTGIWSATGAITNVNALLAGVTFTPTLNFNDNFTIDTSVSDGNTIITGSKSFTGIAVNDTPTASNLSAVESYTEDTPVDLTNIVIADVDNANVTVTLTLSNKAAGSLSTATSNSVVSTYDTNTGVWTANGAIADVNTLLASVTFTPTLNFNANFTIATSVSDGNTSITGSKSFTGIAVNDAPIATNLSAPESYTEDTPVNLTDIVITDVDNANVGVTLTLSNIAAGSLSTATSGAVTSNYNASTGVWSATGAIANVNTLLAGVTFTPTLNFNGNFTVATSVSDGVAPAITGSKAFTGTAVNDAPTATNISTSETYTEDTPINLTDVVVTDVDSANVGVILTLSNTAAGSLSTATSGLVTSNYDTNTGIWSATGAIADVNTLLASVVFTPTLNFNANFTIATSVSDGVAPIITGSKSFTGIAINDAPTATNLNVAESYTEDTPVNLTDIVVADVDNANVTAILTLSNINAGRLSTASSGAVTSTYSTITGAWTASGAVADVNALLAGVTFTPALNFNSNFTLATSVSDGNTTLTGSKSFTGTAVDDAPIATNLNTAESYTEDTPLNLAHIVITDVDSANVTATLTLSNIAAGSLNTATSGSVTSTYNSITGVWSASGALTNVNALLAGVTFTPTLDFNDNFTIDTSVSDGNTTITGSKSFTGIAVNDAPIATNLSAPESYTEDTPVNLTDIVVTDVDSANVTATLTLSNKAAGSLSTATSNSVVSTYDANTGVWTANGAIADVNTLLAGVTFTPTLNFNGNFNIATSVSDGAAPAITGNKVFTGTAVNDTPTATNLNTAESYTEDTLVNLTDIVVADVDNTTVTATLTLSNSAAGSLNTASSGLVTSTYNPGTGIWSASGAITNVNALLAGVTFTPTLNFNSNFTIDTSVSDGNTTITGSKVFTGTAVNDAPTATNLGVAESYTEDTPVNLTAIVVTDVDSANIGATLTLSNTAAGSLSTATSGLVTSNYDPNTGIWSATGAIADVNTLLASVTFTPTLNFNANFSIATSVSDGVAPAITGNKSFTGIAVNDAPTATNLSVPESYTEDTPAALTDIVVTEVDGGSVTATLTLSNVAAGRLSTTTSGAVTSIYNSVTGEWIASGAVADVNTLLASVTFTPTLNFNSDFTIATSVSDGIALAITGSKSFTGTAVNDAPTATNLSTAESFTINTQTALTDIVVTDVDSANVTATLTLSNILAGSLNTASSGSVTSTYDAGTGIWSAAGAIADVNTLLAGVTFTPSLNFHANFNLSTSVSDGLAPAITGDKIVTAAPLIPVTLTPPTTVSYTDTAFVDDFINATGANAAGTLSATGGVGSLTYGIEGTLGVDVTDNGNGTVSKTNTYGTLTVATVSGVYSFLPNSVAIEPLKVNPIEINNSINVTVSDGVQPVVSQPFTVTITQDGITESTGDDNLIGTAGNNTFNALAGNDIIDGKVGADTMTGGTGNDTYFVDNTADSIIENLGEGTDTVNSTISYVLGSDVENLILTGTTAITGNGNALNNQITGNSADNVISGGSGIDTMTGGLGNDSYSVSDNTDEVVENLNGGIDTVSSRAASYTLATNVENLILTGTAAIDGTGNALNNQLTGNIGNNKLDGLAGADTMRGGAGDDTYTVDNTGDVVIEVAGEGIDTVNSSISYTLTADVENLILTGSTAINGTGNALNNQMTGNSADNSLAGGSGIDTMTGGLGNDSYSVSDTTDVIIENLNEGTDTVSSRAASYTLAANVENLILTGTVAINGTGNALNNQITGNSADNVISGGSGIDTMTGGLGNDTYSVSDTTDVVIENLNEGIDTVNSRASSYTLAANVENLVLTGTAAIDGTGNALNNQLTGNSANNVLIGGLGKDTYNIAEATAVTDTLGIATGDSLVSSFDIANGFTLGTGASPTTAGVDRLDLSSVLIAANGVGNGADVGSGANAISSHSISNGIISFDSLGDYDTPVAVTTATNLANVLSYLQTNITGGNTVAFIADTNNTYVFQDGGATDTLVELVGVSATSISTTGAAAGAVWIV